jgi:hypothetical protein
MSTEEKYVKVYEIDWETDGEEVELPERVFIPVDYFEPEELKYADRMSEVISNYLSDNWGWLVGGYTVLDD